MLRLIGHNTNNITVTEIIVALWNSWNKRQDARDKDDNDNDSDPPITGIDEPDDAGPMPEKSAPSEDDLMDPGKSETLPLTGKS